MSYYTLIKSGFSLLSSQSKPVILGGVLVLGITLGAAVNGWRLNTEINKLKLDHTDRLLKQSQKALSTTKELIDATNKAIKSAESEAATNKDAADRAINQRDRLQSIVTQNRSNISTASRPSLDTYTETLSEVFGQCTREYTEVARKADIHASEAMTLFEYWNVAKQINEGNK
jgi:hypothetical protein